MSASSPKPNSSPDSTLWIWRQLAIRLPADWECLQFSSDSDVGRCGFADRRRFRLELNWRTFKAEPDFDRMMKDYGVSLEGTWEGIRSLRCRGWPGITGRRGKEAVSRYGAYFEALKLLVEVVIIHDERRDEGLDARILNTVEPVLPDTQGRQRWRAFGMDIFVPVSFKLAECVSQPARAGIRFDGPRKPDRWIFRRYGMVKSWLTLPLRDWLTAQLEEPVRQARHETITKGNRHIERITGDWRPRGLLLPRGLYVTEAWQNEIDGRLYHAIYMTSRYSAEWHPRSVEDSALTACPEFTPCP